MPLSPYRLSVLFLLPLSTYALYLLPQDVNQAEVPLKQSVKINVRKGKSIMAKQKPKTKTQIVAELAEAAEITKKQAALVLDSLAAQAYKGAKVGFTIPGIGKLIVVDRKARMGRNPATGETIKIPKKKVLKFRIAKAAKDATLG